MSSCWRSSDANQAYDGGCWRFCFSGGTLDGFGRWVPSWISLLIQLFIIACPSRHKSLSTNMIADIYNYRVSFSIMRRIRQFDIITGEPNLPLTNRSFSQPNNPLLSAHKLAPRRLGSPRDQHHFQYSYFEPIQTPMATQRGPRSLMPADPLNSSMLNCVSTPYNLINHGQQHLTSKVMTREMFGLRLPEVRKKSPLTVHLESGKPFSPNYRQDYPDREARHEFHRKSHSFCDQICENEKRSAGKFFRKYK